MEGINKIEVAHYCPDWDYAWITPNSPEFKACTCEEHSDCKDCGTESK